MDQFKVLVRCMTYNQSSYIVDAMNGFCMQQTDFPFLCVIIDDASMDGEQDVIQNYLNEHFEINDSSVVRRDENDDYVRIFVQHKENKNCYFLVIYLKYNHYQIKKARRPYWKEYERNVEYNAINEGDDYWIDSLKLQKQVDYMDSHPDVSLCFCAFKRLLPNGEFQDKIRYEKTTPQCPMNDIILCGGGFMATNSMLYRTAMYIPYTTWTQHSPVGDLPMMLSLAAKGHVAYLSDVMCVYRVAAAGSWTTRMRDSEKVKVHTVAVNKMWQDYDSWTCHKYHRQILRKRWRNYTSLLKSLIGSV